MHLELRSESNRENGNHLIGVSCNRLITKLLLPVQDAFMVLWKHFCYWSPVSQLENNAKIVYVQEKFDGTKKLCILLLSKCQQLLSCCFFFNIQEVKCSIQMGERKERQELREENPLCICYVASFSKLTRGLEWDVNKMSVSEI